MSSRNYDFQLNQPVWIRSLEAYRILEEALEEGKISLSDVAQNVEDVNNGATVEALRSSMPVFLEDGIFGQTYRQVKAVRACMEGALPRINALLSWCEQFQKELGSDTYVDLYVPPEGSNVLYNGGILAMDYNLTEGMQDACDEVEAATDEVTDVLLNALADCRGLVDGADGLMEQVSAASRKLHRVKNLKTAVTLYGMGIKNLERDLQAGWRSAMAETEARKAVYREAEGQRELPTWADHEATQICLALEEYVQTRNYDKMREIMSSMIIEQYDQRDTVNGPATYYVVKLSANRRQQLLEKANDMKLTGAYQFALALEGLRVEGVPADKQGSGSCDIQFGLWTIKDRTIHMSIMTDQTAAWCEVEVGDPLPKEEYTEWDRYIDLGLTGYVKYGYHEIIDYMPDGAMLILGERNAFIRIGSTIQAYAKDDREHLDDYIIQNSRTFSHGFTEGFWDLTLGGLESSINSLVKYVSEPALYFVDTVRGNYEGSTSQRIYKTGLAAMQLMTGQPVFTVNEHAGEVIDAVATVKRNIQAVCELDWQEVAEDVKSLKEQIYLDFQKNPDAFIDNFTDKFYYGSGYLDGAVTGIIADAVVAETVAGVIKGDAVTSYADLMSPEDAEKYLNFLENGSSAGLTDEEIAGIKKLDDLLALEKADYQDILKLRNTRNNFEGGIGVLDNANYAQKTYSNIFSAEGRKIYSDLAGEPINTIDDLVNAINSGKVNVADLPIEYIVRDGNTLILNTRTSQALTQAGIPRSQWNAIDRTGDALFEELLTGQLSRNKLTSEGISTVRPSGGQ